MICVSLAGSSVDEILESLKTLEFAEIRLDKSGLAEGEVRRLFSSSKVPLIATCRPGTMPDPDRFKLLRAAIDSGAAYVDVEIGNPPDLMADLLSLAKEKQCRFIISRHYYQETPMRLVLQQAIDEAFDRGADIAKLVCQVKNFQDCSRLLSLYELKKNILALGLGKIGVLTRIAGPFLGAPFTYASLAPGKETAEGQPDFETLKSILALLEHA